jgi:thioredoxin 1
MTKKIIVVILLLLMAILCFSYFPEYQKSGSVTKQDDRGMSVETYLKKINNPNKLVLVYFHASWCMPCVKLKPEIDALETEEQAVCEVLRIDSDENPKISEYFEINSLPMFILYKDGKKVWENNGFQSKQQLSSKIGTFKK